MLHFPSEQIQSLYWSGVLVLAAHSKGALKEIHPKLHCCSWHGLIAATKIGAIIVTSSKITKACDLHRAICLRAEWKL